MKLFLSLIMLATVKAAASTNPTSEFLTKQNKNHHGFNRLNTATAAAIHRELSGECNDADFACPDHSERKRGRKCYDTFDDCECNPGYKKQDNACFAQDSLCTEDYIDMIQAKQDEVETWVEKAYSAETEEEAYGYIQKMDLVLSEAWTDYNKGKASCEMYVFDDDTGERRLRCCSRLRNGFKKLASGFKKVAKAVIRVVVAVVETVVDLVVEIVECGVGIATDGLKCGLVGCAFGLVGVALDIAFTLATGGLNKAATVLCTLPDALAEDGDDDGVCRTKKCKEQKALSDILIGIGSSVCEVNKKIKSPVLGHVCKVTERLDAAESPTAFLDILAPNAVVLRFAQAFKTAMCGQPGSSVLDLLEEVVNCQIGCAKDDNVFCDIPPELPPAGSPDEEEDIAIEYEKRNGKACRTTDGESGTKGTDFTLVRGQSESQCKTLCSERTQCQAWEYNSSSRRCEIWDTAPKKFEDKEGFDCFLKQKRGVQPEEDLDEDVVEYDEHDGKACRTSDGESGSEGREYSLFRDQSESQCETLCSDSLQCQAWEYNTSSGRCEVWDTKPQKFDEKEGFSCFLKL